jgi:hypothetical protein
VVAGRRPRAPGVDLAVERPPALRVWSRGRWRWATVTARQDWADGRTVYQVHVDLGGSTSVTTRLSSHHRMMQP